MSFSVDGAQMTCGTFSGFCVRILVQGHGLSRAELAEYTPCLMPETQIKWEYFPPACHAARYKHHPAPICGQRQDYRLFCRALADFIIAYLSLGIQYLLVGRSRYSTMALIVLLWHLRHAASAARSELVARWQHAVHP
ncbi:hypothetical protein LshimejAT787_0904890 [Lyophyllum shimeji]|uniref:Uncharacterized protein n=1 Tax=Lyophyllum shimeji TaxID=47721 RepID=A0A9P3UN64_LYOSH|nr:hypothetical protein LshimejAT787_0904890 [Lyophyllum shimeji]